MVGFRSPTIKYAIFSIVNDLLRTNNFITHTLGIPNLASLQFYFIEQNIAQFYCKRDKFDMGRQILNNFVWPIDPS